MLLDSVQRWLMLDQPTFTLVLIWIPVILAVSAFNLWIAFGRRSRPANRSANRSHSIGALGNRILSLAARSRITPNQITLIGLVLVLLNCGFYLVHRDPTFLGSGLVVAYVFDTLDGLVARAQGTSSRFGGYLDAVVDRLQETATLAAIGWVTGLWLPAFLAITGSMLTSYNKARAAIEIPVDNKGWPDFFDKTVRQFFLCFALIATDSIPWLLAAGLWFLAAASYFTAFQRMIRAYVLICDYEQTERQYNGSRTVHRE